MHSNSSTQQLHFLSTRTLITLLIPLMLLAGTTGCQRLSQGAIEIHAKSFSCPENRITVTAKKDLDAYALQFGTHEPEAAIKTDTERYAVWKKNETKKHKEWNSQVEVFETTGCGHTATYSCFHPATIQSKGAANYAVTQCILLRDQADVQ